MSLQVVNFGVRQRRYCFRFKRTITLTNSSRSTISRTFGKFARIRAKGTGKWRKIHMSAQDIVKSLTGQKVSQKSTFLPCTLNNLMHDDISHKMRDNSSMLTSLGYIILTGNGSYDRAIEGCCNKCNYRTLPRPPALAGGVSIGRSKEKSFGLFLFSRNKTLFRTKFSLLAYRKVI